MDLREWGLIIFTILAQMAVGSFLALGIVHFFAERRLGEAMADRLTDRALLLVGPVLVLGMIASLFHLGTPLSAYRAVTNLGSSWLSREILFAVLFAALGAAFALMQWRKVGSYTTRTLVAWLAALAGLALVYSMARVYMLRTVPIWNTLATPVSFFTTTFLLGSLAVGVAFVANYAYVQRQDPELAEAQRALVRASLRWIALAAIVLLGVQFLVAPLSVAYLAALGGVAGASAGGLFSQYGALFALRLVLVFLGAGVAALFLYQNTLVEGRERALGNLAYLVFALVLVAEVMGRFLFYATYGRLGV